MSKFKVGDRVFSISEGVTRVEIVSPTGCYPIETLNRVYTADGKEIDADKHPSLYTLAEARRMGFPVPAEPKTYEATVEMQPFMPQDKVVLPAQVGRAFEGKRVRVTIEEVDA